MKDQTRTKSLERAGLRRAGRDSYSLFWSDSSHMAMSCLRTGDWDYGTFKDLNAEHLLFEAKSTAEGSRARSMLEPQTWDPGI